MTRKELVQQKATVAFMKREATRVINGYIQATVDAYNEANGTDFEKIHNCTAYKDITTYPHRQFCIDVLEWNALVWETARNIEADVLAGTREIPTAEELIAELPTLEV